MKRSRSFFAAALVLGLAAAAQSKADTIPSISFQWVQVVPVDLPASTSNGHGGYTQDQSGGAFFVPENGGPFLINQETQTAAANVILSTSASPTNPDHILAPASGTNYSVDLKLTRDYTVNGVAKVATANITFNSLLTGTMVGSYQSNGTTIAAVAELTNTIHDISVNGVDTLVSAGTTNPAITVTLGDASVVVKYVDFAPVEPNQHNPGTISFDITPSAGSVGIQGGSTPEPSGIVLGCMGLSCIGGVFWRSRRRKTIDALKAAV